MAASGGKKPASPNLMTAYVILQDHPLSARGSRPDITVEPSDAAAYPSHARDGDTIVAIAGAEAMAEPHALEALLPPSTDNTAGLLARCNAGSQDAFTAKMHAAASRLARTGPGQDRTVPSPLTGSQVGVMSPKAASKATPSARAR
jgi:D-alanyl-D-alanine carboxypeptidase (penicillin-binding protein 5/6)